jgi:signal transduction histidine kinase
VSAIIGAVDAGRFLTISAFALAYSTHSVTLLLASLAAARASTREQALALVPAAAASLVWLVAVNALRRKVAARRPTDARVWAASAALIVSGVALELLRVPFAIAVPVTFVSAVVLLTAAHEWPASAALATAFGVVSGLAALAALAALAGVARLAGPAGLSGRGEETAAAFVLTALYLPAAAYVQSLRRGVADLTDRFDHARWAASELSNVVMRLDTSVNRARVTTLIEERRRVAREVHDTVGYALTALIVQLSLLRELVGAAEPAGERVARLETMVRDALEEIRLKVTDLRADARSGGRDWREVWLRLTSTFSECTAVRVRAEIDNWAGGAGDRAGETIYRILQETLTNAYRHGQATYVFVGVRYRSELGKILVKVSDNGSGCADLAPGNGLAGLRERVAVMGGTVTWDTAPGRGFDIGIDIPWEGEVGKDTGPDRG